MAGTNQQNDGSSDSRFEGVSKIIFFLSFFCCIFRDLLYINAISETGTVIEVVLLFRSLFLKTLKKTKYEGVIRRMMKKLFCALMACSAVFAAQAAYQYNIKGNQGWLTFDSTTTLTLGLGRSGKDNDHVNFIDRGKGVQDYGWYNLDTGKSGSFGNGVSATFTKDDRIGLYVKDETGNVFLTSKKPKGYREKNVIWGKTRVFDGNINLAGGNFGSNGTHEYYVFKVNTSGSSGKAPSGQPLPGVIAVLALGGAAFGIHKLRSRKKKAEKIEE